MEYVRIDKGVKRGSREGRKPGFPGKRDAQSRFVAVLDPAAKRAAIEQAADRIERGELLQTIATEIGVTIQCLSKWLLDDLPERYHAAQRVGLIARVTQADHNLAVADSPIELSRAREQCRFSRWDAERRLPRLFGQQHHLTVELVGDLGDRLRRARERVTDGETLPGNYTQITQVPDSIPSPTD